MKNIDRVRGMSPKQLKDWFCEGRDCGKCQFNSKMICGFSSWLYSEAREDEKARMLWAEEPLEALNLQPRVQRALFDNGIRTLGHLCEIRIYDLKQCDGIGEVIAANISKAFYHYTGEKMKK